jgi:hypothetical protein
MAIPYGNQIGVKSAPVKAVHIMILPNAVDNVYPIKKPMLKRPTL